MHIEYEGVTLSPNLELSKVAHESTLLRPSSPAASFQPAARKVSLMAGRRAISAVDRDPVTVLPASRNA
jgi:hypothetical protein